MDSLWILPGVLVTLAVSLVATGVVSRAFGAPRWMGWLLVMSLGLILAGTLTPLRDLSPSGVVGPFRCDLSRLGIAPYEELFAVNDTSFNVLMVVPLGVSLAILPRSWPKVLAVVAGFALPFAIEGAQGVLRGLGRGCESADVIDNLLGLVIGLSVGGTTALILMVVRHAVRLSRSIALR